MRKRLVFRSLIMAAVALSWCAGFALSQDMSYRTKRQNAWDAVEQAARAKAPTDPMFQKSLNEVANAPIANAKGTAKAAAPAAQAAARPAGAPVGLPNGWPGWAANVAPPHYNPGIGFNNAVNYDLPNYSQSPNIRKFVNGLPGLGVANCVLGTPLGNPLNSTCHENELGQYIPVAVADTAEYPYSDPQGRGADYYEIAVKNYSQQMHSDMPATFLRGYVQTNGTAGNMVTGVNQYLGPLIIARVFNPNFLPGASYQMPGGTGLTINGAPVRLKYTNALPISTSTNPFPNSPKMGLPIDTTLMGAGMSPTGVLFTENRVNIPHLHGGRTPWISDGTIHQWITPAGEPNVNTKGLSFQNVPDMISNGTSPCAAVGGCFTPTATDGIGTSYFTNQQSGRFMFWHDHAYGITRLNVYKGLAAGYLLVDQVEDDLIDGTNKSGGNPSGVGLLPNLGGIYRYGIPLVIQDKAFVNDALTPPGAGFPLPAVGVPGAPPLTYDPSFLTSEVDPLWATYVGTTGGQLWVSHEYLPVENIFDTTGGSANPVSLGGNFWPAGNTTNGRWDYGPFMIPPMVPQTSLTLPSPTITPEAFGDTMVVNGTAFPYLSLPPDTVRFRILNAGNDRTLNLSLFYAKDRVTGNLCAAVAPPGYLGPMGIFTTANCTEVGMVSASPDAGNPTWPRDGRDGGVPDPTTKGPHWWMIGNDGGLLAQLADVPPQPVDFNYNRQIIALAGITSHSLLILPAERLDVVADFTGGTAGDVLIVYNDGPAPAPNFWPLNDYYTDCPDQRFLGGPSVTAPGFGPNTRTVMQIRIAGTKSAFAWNPTTLAATLPVAFSKSQDKPIVPQLAYNAAFPGFATSDMYVQAPDSTLNITGVGAPLSLIRTIAPGNNYLTAPTVTIIGKQAVGGVPAVATAGLNPVTAITLVTNGSGYLTVPAVTISAPAVAGITATAVATISGGQVTAVTIVEPGSGYTSATAPTVTIAAPTGAGGVVATATASNTLNAVGSITLTNPGTGYLQEPRVYLIGGGGMGASAVALVQGAVVMTSKNITEGFDPWFGRMDIRMGSTPNPLTPNVGNGFVIGMAQYIDPPTEFVNDGEVTLWRITHLGVDTHALHFHLFDVQVVNYVDWTNVVKPPQADYLGWRDTIRTNPMEDVIVAFKPHQAWLPFSLPRSNRLLDPTTVAGSTVNFLAVPPPIGTPAVGQLSNVMTDFAFEYVWHCHMMNHEENDFMRPLSLVVPLPPAPTLTLVPVTVATSVTLNWTMPVGAPSIIKYTIQRSTSSTFPVGATTVSFTVVGNPPALTYTNTTTVAGQRYYYRVQATSVGGDSAFSNAVIAITIFPPTGLATTTVGVNYVALHWTALASTTGVTGLQIQRATNAAFTTGLSAVANLATTATTYTVTGLTGATVYYFRVGVVTAFGTVWAPVLGPITTFTVLPPTGLAAPTKTTTSVTLSWTTLQSTVGVTAIQVQRATNAGFTTGLSGIANLPVTATTLRVTGLTTRTAYYFRVGVGTAAGSLWAPVLGPITTN